MEARDKGSLIAHEDGTATPFGITGAQSRGSMIIGPKDNIYRDMIVGIHQRPGDLRVNVCKVWYCCIFRYLCVHVFPGSNSLHPF